MFFIRFNLELLSYHKMELASAVFLIIKSITPVYTEQAHHRELSLIHI